VTSDEHPADALLLRPEDVTTEDIPVAVRGYDRHSVDRRMGRIAESYERLLRQRDELRERVEADEARVVAAEDEAKVSARQVATLTQRGIVAEEQLAALRRRVAELEDALDAARRTPPAPEPSAPASLIPEARAAELLLAAKGASEQLRRATREDARVVLRKARAKADAVAMEADRQQRAMREQEARIASLAARAEEQRRAVEAASARVMALSAEAERERQAADAARARRDEAEQEARRMLDRARDEAERAIAALGEQKRRVRGMLGQALDALAGDDKSSDVLADLSARLRAADRDPAGTDRP
jgi:chromosome segregation protein